MRAQVIITTYKAKPAASLAAPLYHALAGAMNGLPLPKGAPALPKLDAQQVRDCVSDPGQAGTCVT